MVLTFTGGSRRNRLADDIPQPHHGQEIVPHIILVSQVGSAGIAQRHLDAILRGCGILLIGSSGVMSRVFSEMWDWQRLRPVHSEPFFFGLLDLYRSSHASVHGGLTAFRVR
jgi:hypothetical protein